MQTIRAGDLFFLNSPFHDDCFNTDKEKRLSYLLGTLSARPAIVIRPPAWWDSFSMVTVVPAISRGNPALVYHLKDRYDRETKAQYSFLPHHITSIPVTRLGHYIGSLEDHELKELMDTIHWIIDPLAQKDPKVHVPAIYKDVMKNKLPKGSWITPRDPRSDIDIRISEDGSLKSSTNPEIDGLRLETEVTPAIRPSTQKAITNEPAYVPTKTALPDSVSSKPHETAVPVEKEFPPSIFSRDILMQVASNFDINCGKFLKMETRNAFVLKVGDTLVSHRLSDKAFDQILYYYNTLTPFDAYHLGPRLPTHVLSEITGCDPYTTTILKGVCNVMRDMTEEDYVYRLSMLDDCNGSSSSSSEVEEIPDYNEMVRPMIPYLNPSTILRMPENLQPAFMQIPKGILKRAWSGKQFDASYKLASSKFKKG